MSLPYRALAAGTSPPHRPCRALLGLRTHWAAQALVVAAQGHRGATRWALSPLSSLPSEFLCTGPGQVLGPLILTLPLASLRLRPAQPYLPAAAQPCRLPCGQRPSPSPLQVRRMCPSFPAPPFFPRVFPLLPFSSLSSPRLPPLCLPRHAPTRDRKELGGLWTAATVRTPPMSASEAAGQRPPRPLPSRREDQLTRPHTGRPRGCLIRDKGAWARCKCEPGLQGFAAHPSSLDTPCNLESSPRDSPGGSFVPQFWRDCQAASVSVGCAAEPGAWGRSQSFLLLVPQSFPLSQR